MPTEVDLTNVLSNRLESLENRFHTHSVKLEDRLDTMVDLLQKVTALQEKEQHNSDSIKELREDLRAMVLTENESLKRVHERHEKMLDEIKHYRDDDTRERQRLQTEISNAYIHADKEMREHEEEARVQFIEVTQLIQVVKDSLGTKISDVDREQKKYIHFTQGILWAAGVALIGVQSIGAWYLNKLNEDIGSLDNKIAEVKIQAEAVESSNKALWVEFSKKK